MSRRVHFAQDPEYDENRTTLKRVPTPHSKVTAGRRRGSSSSEGEENTSMRTPITRKVKSRRSKKVSRSSNSDSSNGGGGRKHGYRKYKMTKASREDGRGSVKERRRKSEVARNLPRRSDGKFASGSDSAAAVFPASSYKTPPRRSPRKYVQEEEEETDESFLDTTPPKLPRGRYINDLVQTPQFQRMLKKQLMEALNGMGGSLVDFNSDASDSDYQLDEDEEEEDRNRNLTPPRVRRNSQSRM